MARPKIEPISKTQTSRPTITPLQSTMVGGTTPVQMPQSTPAMMTPMQPRQATYTTPVPQRQTSQYPQMMEKTWEGTNDFGKADLNPVRYGGAGIKGALGELQHMGRKLEVPLVGVAQGMTERIQNVEGFFSKITKPFPKLNLEKQEQQAKEQGFEISKAPMQKLIDRSTVPQRREEGLLTPAEEVMYNVGSGVGGMIPSIAVGTVNPLAGKAVFFSGASQGHYKQALEEGKTETQANVYGTVMGIAEMAAESVGGFLPWNMKATAGKSIFKVAAEEALEEGIMPLIEEITKRVLFKEKGYEGVQGAKDLLKDSLVDAAYGATIAVILQGATQGAVKTKRLANKIINNESLTKAEVNTAINEINQNSNTTVQQQVEKILTETEANLLNSMRGQKQAEQTIGRPTITPMQTSTQQVDNTGKQIPQEIATQLKDSNIDTTDQINKNTWYHGTPTGDFDKFMGTSYWTLNKNIADIYQSPTASSISYGKKTTTPKTFEAQLNVEKPFDTKNDAEARRIYLEEYMNNYSVDYNGKVTDRGYPDWMEGNYLEEFLKANYPQYDSLLFDEGGLPQSDGSVLDRGISIAVFNPNHIIQPNTIATPMQTQVDNTGKKVSQEVDSKQQQMDIINKNNPMTDDYHTGIRSVNDIKTAQEAFTINNFEETSYPDFSFENSQKAIKDGTITVYSSNPIENGGFVSTSKMMAQDYAGDNKIYSKTVPINEVAWIDNNEGQYAKVDTIGEAKTDDVLTIKPLTKKQQAKKDAADAEAKTVETLKKDITKAYSKVIPNKFSKKYVKIIKKNPDLVKDIVATKPNGQLAIRDSGVFTPKSFNLYLFKDIKGFAGQQSYNLLAAAGEFDNMTIQQASRKGEWGLMKQFAFEMDKSIANRQVYVVNAVYKIESIAKKHNVKINPKTGQQLFDALEGRPATLQMKALAEDIRTELNKLRLDANIHRQSLGKPKIGFIKYYVPHLQKVSFFNKKIGDTQTTISDNFDFMIPNAKVNPHAIARTGADFKMETNAWKLLDTYINSISNDVYTTLMIEQAKSVNQVIMENNPAMGNFMNTYIKEQLVGQTAKIDRIIGMQPGTVKRDVASIGTRVRNTASLAGNFLWSLFTQPASMVNTGARTGFGNTFKGLLSYATNKQVQNQVNQLPSMIIKSKGKSVGRTIGGDVDRLAAKIGKTKLDKFNDFLALFPDAMESVLTGASAAAGYEQGRKLGLTGEALDMYADTVAQTTQSMYGKEFRPVIMNNTSVRLAAPFQTFAFEQYRYAKQLMGKGGGIPLEARDRLAQAMRLIISMWLYGMYAEKMTGKKLNTPGTFVPFAGSLVDEGLSKVGQTIGITPREYSGAGRSPVAPLEETKKIYEAIDTLVQYGNFTPMRKELVKWGMGIGGVGGASTVNRFVDGIIASEQGYQTTRAGRVAFPVTTTKDKITAMTMGPYATKGGKEYIKGGFKPLGDNQSSTIKSSTNIERDFNTMMKAREYNRLINEYNKLRSEGKSTVDIEKKIRNFK